MRAGEREREGPVSHLMGSVELALAPSTGPFGGHTHSKQAREREGEGQGPSLWGDTFAG